TTPAAPPATPPTYSTKSPAAPRANASPSETAPAPRLHARPRPAPSPHPRAYRPRKRTASLLLSFLSMLSTAVPDAASSPRGPLPKRAYEKRGPGENAGAAGSPASDLRYSPAQACVAWKVAPALSASRTSASKDASSNTLARPGPHRPSVPREFSLPDKPHPSRASSAARAPRAPNPHPFPGTSRGMLGNLRGRNQVVCRPNRKAHNGARAEESSTSE